MKDQIEKEKTENYIREMIDTANKNHLKSTILLVRDKVSRLSSVLPNHSDEMILETIRDHITCYQVEKMKRDSLKPEKIAREIEDEITRT